MSNIAKARDFIHMDPEEVLSYPKRFQMEFDNGEVLEVQRKLTWASMFAWRILRKFPGTPVLPQHHFQFILDGKNLQSSTHNKCASNLFKTIVGDDGFISPEDREIFQYEVQCFVNDLYNGLREKSGRHLQTIDIVDCIKVMMQPQILDAWINAETTPRGVDEVNKVIKDAVYKDPELKDNGMASAMRSGSVKANQVFQSVGVRGFPKEIDGRIYRTMIRSNYVWGITNLYEFASDSRGSAEHLMATESPLQDSEYFSRRLQLQTCVLERIEYTDCGTSRTIPWLIKPPAMDESSGDFYTGDLIRMIGKKYIDPKTGKLLTILGTEKHLYGKVVQVRSVITCEHKDPHSVCQVCFGAVANNHSRWANVGVVAATTIVSKISQKTLSTKHHIASGQGSGIVFSTALKTYFRRGPKNTDYVLEKDTARWGLKLIVPRDGALGLVDIENTDASLESLNPERITGFDIIRITGKQPDSCIEFSDSLTVMQGNRLASMSIKLLEYIQKHGKEMDNRNNFVVDLKHWNFDDVLLTLPDIQVSFSAHGNAIAEVIESKFSQMSERSSEDAPIRVLNQVFDMIAPKLPDVNFVAVECVVYPLQIPKQGSYAMSRGSSSPVMGIGKDLILNRSMGTACAYQEWKYNILSPKSYVSAGKPSTVMDVFICPREVVAEFKAKKLHPDRVKRHWNH